MSWFSSMIGSALTPPGTNAAREDANRKKKPQQMAGGYLADLDPLIRSQIAFARGIEPDRQRAIGDLMWAGTPNGVRATTDQARREFMGAEMAALPMMRQAVSRGGAGIGAMQGAELSALNRGVTAGNDLTAWFATPEGKEALARMRLGASQYALPSLADFSNLSSVVYGAPTPQVGASPLAGIGQALGLGFAGGWKPFGGGG